MDNNITTMYKTFIYKLSYIGCYIWPHSLVSISINIKMPYFLNDRKVTITFFQEIKFLSKEWGCPNSNGMFLKIGYTDNVTNILIIKTKITFVFHLLLVSQSNKCTRWTNFT